MFNDTLVQDTLRIILVTVSLRNYIKPFTLYISLHPVHTMLPCNISSYPVHITFYGFCPSLILWTPFMLSFCGLCTLLLLWTYMGPILLQTVGPEPMPFLSPFGCVVLLSAFFPGLSLLFLVRRVKRRAYPFHPSFFKQKTGILVGSLNKPSKCHFRGNGFFRSLGLKIQLDLAQTHWA